MQLFITVFAASFLSTFTFYYIFGVVMQKLDKKEDK